MRRPIFYFINLFYLKADNGSLVRYPIETTAFGSLHTSIVGLKFRTEKQHFEPDGDMKLKCTASIGTIYWQTNEKSAEGYKSKRASMASSSTFDSFVHNAGVYHFNIKSDQETKKFQHLKCFLDPIINYIKLNFPFHNISNTKLL